MRNNDEQNWPVSTLGEIAKFLSGGTPNKGTPKFWGGPVPWITVKDMKTLRLSKSLDTLTNEGADEIRTAPQGSLLILVRGMSLFRDLPIGIAECELTFNQDIKALVPNNGVDSEFLAYAVLAQKAEILRHVDTAGHGTGRLDTELLRAVPLRIPTYWRQRRIAEILRTWDEAIDKTERLIAAKEKRIRGMMCSTLTAPHDDAGEWIKTTLGEVLDVATRRVVWDEEAKYRLITVKRACGGIVFRGDRKGSEILTKDMYLVRAGDFVISRRQVVHGAWAMAAAQFDGAHVSKEYACLVAKADRLWMPYFDWLSRTPQVRHLSFICSYGVDIEKMVLNLDWLLQSKIVIPRSIAKQKRIAAALDCGDQEARLLRQHLTALQTQKRGLMQKLLTGEWPVPLRDSDVDALAQRVPQEAAE